MTTITDSEAALETWGFCRGCNRWFYCGKNTTCADACPVCGSAADILEDRAVAD